MLVGFFALWAAPASILGRPGQVLEPSKPHLTMFFGVRARVSQKCSSCNKTIVFAMFYKLRNMPHTATEHVFCIAFKAFLDMVYGLLQKIPAGIHLLLFMTTLQRGGTCAAHGIGPKWLPDLKDHFSKSDLKLNVFSKWCFGRLRARFWTLQGSILVPPRPDSRANNVQHWLAATPWTSSFLVTRKRNPKTAKNAKNG